MITLEIVQSTERFEALAPAWNALWAERGGSVFQAHAWIAAWHQHFATDYDLLVGLAWEGDRLRSILPCAARRYLGVRILEWAAQTLSDYCDALGDAANLAALLTKALEVGRIDILRVKNVGPEAIARPALDRSKYSLSEEDVCLKVRSLWSNGDAWFRTLNKKKRNNHARGGRKLAEMGVVTIDYLDEVSEDEIIQLLALKQGWLKSNGLSSPLVDAGRGLLVDLVNSLASIKKLSAVLIKCNGEIVAGSINAVDGTRLLAFFAAYDPRFECASPGIRLMTEYTRWAFDRGFTEIDYLRGEESYKFEFANDRTALRSYSGACSGKGEIALRAFQLVRFMKAKRPGTTGANGGAYLTKTGVSRLETLK